MVITKKELNYIIKKGEAINSSMSTYLSDENPSEMSQDRFVSFLGMVLMLRPEVNYARGSRRMDVGENDLHVTTDRGPKRIDLDGPVKEKDWIWMKGCDIKRSYG